MQTWSTTLHGPSGIIRTVDTGESQFVIGTETASDVLTVQGEAIAPRHAWVWISEAGLQVEDLGGGTLVNGYQISERVEVKYPASVQVGDLTLVVEVKAMQPLALSATSSSLDITISQRAVTKSKASLDVTIPQRTPRASNVQKSASLGTASAQSDSRDKASPTCEYTLVREIARGGMGQIYFGEDPQLERQVAIKVSSISEEGEDPRFSKEAKVLAQLAHPNIVPIYNIGVDAQSRPFYSMKLIKGRTLQAVLNLIRDGDAAAVKDYPRATLLTIFRKVCDAMMFAHSKGILHRDLKPENIMVGEYGEVLVMDWGLAKMLGEREEQSSSVSRVNDTGNYGMTMEGEVMGTPQYMSPEQAMGMVAELDQRSDIYSLGGILYAILTLRPPIEGTTLDEVLTKVKNGSIRAMVTKRGGKDAVTVGAPKAMGAEVPEALQAVTLKALATDRNKRYASVEEFAGDIERYQNGFATPAAGAGTVRKLMLFIRRNKGLSSAAALVFVVAVAFTIRLVIEKERAVVAMEKSRREAAQAQIVIAEAAHHQGKADEMHLALSNVPEDLRGQTWSYLNDATTLGHVGIAPDEESSWAGLEADPSQSGNFLALQSNGTCVNVDSTTGASTVRWKANDIKPRYGEFAVASDGSAVAIGIGSEIQIRRVEDGVIVQRIKLPPGTGVYSRLWLFKDQLFVQISENRKHFLSAWSVADGRLLWRRPQRIWPAFCAVDDSPSTICLLTGEGKLEKINAITGDIVEQGKAVVGQVGWRKEAIAGNSGWKTFALSNDERRVRVYSNPWSDTLRTEFLPDHDVASLALVPNSELLLVLCMPSDQAGCLEVRDCSQGGKLLRSFPFQNPKLRRDFSNALRCTDSHVALLLPNKIRIWNLLTADKPLFNVTQPQGKKFHTIKMSPNGRELLGLRVGDDQKLKEVCLYNLSETGALSKEISQTAIADGRISISATPGISIQMSKSGSVAIVQDRVNAIALSLGDGKIINAWGLPKTLQANDKQDRLILPHPSLGLLWTGEAVVDISSGAQLTQVNRTLFKSLGRWQAPTPCWIGSDRLVEHCWVDGVRDSQDPEAYLERVMVLWNTSTGEAVSYESSSLGVCLSVSSDGNQIAEGCKDRRVRFRNAKNLAVEGEFLVHNSAVSGVDWHPNGLILATMGDSEIRLWDVKTGRLLEEIRIKQLAKSLRFLAGGRRLIVGDLVFEPKSCRQELEPTIRSVSPR